MTEERWLYLDSHMDTAILTKEEIDLKWHWCWDWDGLFIGPGMSEMEFCHCFDNDT